MTLPTMRAAANMDSAAIRSWPALASPSCRERMLTTDWVTERLPAVSNTNSRSPGRSNTNILRKVETRSTPALVRESEAKARPSFTLMPTQ